MVPLLSVCLGSAYVTVVIGVLLFACVDPDGGGVLGRLTGVIYDLPARASPVVRFLVGARVERGLCRCMTYACDEPNPIMQSLYATIICGAYGAVLLVGYPRLPCSTLAEYHKWTGLCGFAACLGSFVAACKISPGFVVDAESEARFESYAYDGALFVAGRRCPTTGVRKLARSKFCRTVGANVARFDHFCPWLNAPVGEENYRWFLLFLLLHVALLWYGAVACGLLLVDVYQREKLGEAVFFDARTGGAVRATRAVIAHYLVATERAIVAVLALCVVMGIMVGGFFVYHLWLLGKGTTTNEHYKRQDLVARRARARLARLRSPVTPSDETSPADAHAEHEPPLTNIYDLGFLANLHEVIRPRSLRADALRRADEARLCRPATKAPTATPRTKQKSKTK